MLFAYCDGHLESVSNVDLARGEIIFTQILSKTAGDFCRDVFLPTVYSTDDLEQFALRSALSYIRRRSSTERPLNNQITIARRQHYDSSEWKLFAVVISASVPGAPGSL